jgi:hypothetical protein
VTGTGRFPSDVSGFRQRLEVGPFAEALELVLGLEQVGLAWSVEEPSLFRDAQRLNGVPGERSAKLPGPPARKLKLAKPA